MFESLTELRKYAQAWMWMYNNERSHSALGYLVPLQLLLKYGKLPTHNHQSQFPTFQQDINIMKKEKEKRKFLNLNVAN